VEIVWNGYHTISTFANVICISVLCLNLKNHFTIICNIPFNIVYVTAILLVTLVIVLIMRKNSLNQTADLLMLLFPCIIVPRALYLYVD